MIKVNMKLAYWFTINSFAVLITTEIEFNAMDSLLIIEFVYL